MQCVVFERTNTVDRKRNEIHQYSTYITFAVHLVLLVKGFYNHSPCSIGGC